MSASHLRSPRAGFALLITITLLAFVVLLLVGLATYTRVETAIAGNTQRQAQARQNALLALDVALAQLQKHAGPDQRVTATAESFGGVAGTKYFTGVWDNTNPTAAPVWLVSGSENGLIDPKIAPATARRAELVGAKTSGVANDVVATLQDLTTVGVPGQNGSATIGRYAWWIGDQGVKAPVGLGDNTAAITYAPYDSAELRSRIRQQISLGASPTQFEPRSDPFIKNVTASSQLAFLKTSTGASLGLTALQQNYHAWSANNFAVLANIRLGGLRQDLSIDPTLLGAAYAAWCDYPTYTDYSSPGTAGVPSYAANSPARRVKMQPAAVGVGAVHSISPVLAECGLSFNIRTQSSGIGAPLEVRARWYVSLWNPYTTALLLEKQMRLEVSGLPDPVNFTVTVSPTSGGGAPSITTIPIPLYALFQDVTHPTWRFPLHLGWDETQVANQPDMQAWLPGRVYTWISTEHSLTPTPPGGLIGAFYTTNFGSIAGQGDTRNYNATLPTSSGSATSSVSFSGPIQLVAKLYRNDSDPTPLATFNAPAFIAVPTTDASQAAGAKNYQFGFIFRLFESGHVDVGDKGAWLTASSAVDVRSSSVPSNSFRLDPAKADDPAQYQTTLDFNDSKYLLDRTQGKTPSMSYNEDVPLFELPRAPLLSVGQLQHLALDQRRPFSIGNSWGSGARLNGINVDELFDRFYFSGLVAGVVPPTVNGSLLLPNPLLKVIPRLSGSGAAVTPADLQSAPNAQSSKFLLQGGAFNLNSINPAAWAAVLRAVRFPAPASFTYLNADAATGTADDASIAAAPTDEAQFFRFSQSAQETFKAEPGLATGSGTSPARTELFRQGMKTLAAPRVADLATKITDAIKLRQSASGPFRSLEEFLNPAVTGGSSLLEQAIAAVPEINADAAGNPIEFSSQFLTQGDIMTALAPVLFPRSDTFVIRTYGEAVNPATGATEGRAWCEATVQRVPEYFDKTQPEETAPADLNSLNQTYGRRFKVVSFRWLTRSDI